MGRPPDVIILRMIHDIAIDGPAASGKTVVGRRLAQRLGWWFLDTGIMYRAVTWLALEQGVAPDDADTLGGLVEFVQVKPVSKDGDSVEVAGRRVGPELRESRVDNNVSNVSKHPAVRRALVKQQRNYAGMVVRGVPRGSYSDSHPHPNPTPTPEREGRVEAREGKLGGIVMIGRDIGTVVLPDAGLKVFLTASAEQRALRRWREMRERGQEIELATVQSEIEARDIIDSSRDDSPLRPAADAWRLDTSGITVDEAVEAILRRITKSPPPQGEG